MSAATWGFTIAVDHPLDDDELVRLYEVGGDDTAPVISATQTLIHFDRVARTLGEAVASALSTVLAAGLIVVGVTAPELAR